MRKEMLFCDGCDVTTPADNISGVWITIKLGFTEYHLCSQECFRGWAIEHLSLRVPAQEPQEQPVCKARRFLLVDENANITEGVKFGNGGVMMEGDSPATYRVYYTWEALKSANPGSGVQWIDQEVSE
jgi:hypothetical protein